MSKQNVKKRKIRLEQLESPTTLFNGNWPTQSLLSLNKECQNLRPSMSTPVVVYVKDDFGTEDQVTGVIKVT